MRTPIVVGRGRIGSMMADCFDRAGIPALLLGSEDDPASVTQSNPGGPIVVCTRNDDLDGLLADVHPDNLGDLVFVQNGALRAWLEDKGLLGATQGVLWVAVTAVGARPIPGGERVCFGPWASEVARAMNAGGVRARALGPQDEATLRREMAIKLAWISIFGLLGEATGLNVGAIAMKHRADVEGLCAELAPVLGVALDTSLPVGQLFERVQEYSVSIRDYPAGLKEWRWRNGWVVEVAAAARLALPRHEAWLSRTKREG